MKSIYLNQVMVQWKDQVKVCHEKTGIIEYNMEQHEL